MESINKIRNAIAVFYDTEIRPTLPDAKGRLIGFGIGVALAKPEVWIGKVLPIAQAIGAADEQGNVDVDMLAREAKKSLFGNDGVYELKIAMNPFKPADLDVFRFKPADVDKLVEIINRM